VLPAPAAQANAYRTALRPLLRETQALVEQLLDQLDPALTARADDISASRLRTLLARLRSAFGRLYNDRALGQRLAPTLRARAEGVERVGAAALKAQLEAVVRVNPTLPADAVATTLAKAGEARLNMRASWIGENVKLVASVGQRARREVEQLVRAAAAKGTSIEALSRQLRERLDVTRSRSDLIARDQTTKLAAQVNEAQQRAIGVHRYTWRHSGVRLGARPEHLARDGQVFDWSKPPPDGHPGAAPNCRCTAEPVIEDVLGDPQVQASRARS